MLTRRGVLTLGTLGCLSATGQPLPRTLLVASGEIPPYASARSEDSFLGALFDEIGPEMGAALEFRYMPWKRCEAAVDDLAVWGAVPYVPTPEREARCLFSAPLYAKKTKLFYYAPGDQAPPVASYSALAELRRFRIGGVRGYYYEQLLRDAGIQMDAAVSEEQNFKKLFAGRVDFVAAVDTVGWSLIPRLFSPREAKNFHTLETPLHVGFNYLMTSKRFPETGPLLERFNAALEKLRRDGRYKRVADRFGLGNSAN
ncbi:polar amino acid transport system substrate-binding protein [Roseateles sp. YR242]|uniref:substrate-binding periplasmic protein n=1 Tax=Roseateles sp. YR242 TaxID=1855305 RepID=UPI0008B492CB|nr:transporter substrate-binding domain-containing protein [Roseateles sp. YR242]SEL11507.1 polar amino acid transport system substrate-binding protein [Roseateles sp. YR242]